MFRSSLTIDPLSLLMEYERGIYKGFFPVKSLRIGQSSNGTSPQIGSLLPRAGEDI